MTTHYISDSRGPVEIATMPFRHLQNSYDKLVRDQIGEARQDEIDAMRARLDALNAEYAAAEAAKAEAVEL